MGKNETKNYVGGSGMDDMELDDRDIQLMEESRKEGKKGEWVFHSREPPPAASHYRPPLRNGPRSIGTDVANHIQ